jgi:hypothetical protein
MFHVRYELNLYILLKPILGPLKGLTTKDVECLLQKCLHSVIFEIDPIHSDTKYWLQCMLKSCHVFFAGQLTT